ncbi:MAG: AAA family ATPase [Candidatus Methanoplasma sp.]|jgi:predicted AAA+ superfamily ATPase|nr:AAA family ATPase [Candidatus Methanoplasma sp.]
MLRRKISDELMKWKANPGKHPLLVTGARQVGKTYAIEHFAESNYERVIYMNFEKSPSLKGIFGGDLDADALMLRITARFSDAKIIPGKTVIVLDEIQSCPNARTAMKSLSGDLRFDTIATGSLLGLNQSKVSLYPTGYEEYMDMHTMDFEEFLWAIGTDSDLISSVRNKLNCKEPLDPFITETFEEHYRTYMAVGGMPEAVDDFVTNRDFSRVRAIQKKIIRSYEDDISKYAEGIAKARARECLHSVPDQIGRRFRYTDVKGVHGARRSMYDGGIEWLIGAGVVFKSYKVTDLSPPLTYSRSMNLFKLFLHDVGLLVAMMERDTASMLFEGNSLVNGGKVAENVTACEIVSRNVEPMYFGEKDLEVDFVTVIGKDVAAIEVKSGNNKMSKSLDSVMSRSNARIRGVKLEHTNVNIDDNGVEHYPLFAGAFIFPDDSGYKL